MISCGGFVSPPFELSDAFFHLFAWFERDHELLWYKDFFAGTRVTSFACSPLFDLEYAEIPQLNSLILDQSVDNCVERLLDDLFGLELGKTDLFGNGLYDFFFRHDEVPYEKDRRAAATVVERPSPYRFGRCGKAPFSLQV